MRALRAPLSCLCFIVYAFHLSVSAARSYPDQASVEVVYGNESWGIRMIRHQKRLETLGTFLETLTSPVDFLCQVRHLTMSPKTQCFTQ